MIAKEEEIGEEKSEVREQTKEDDDKMDNMVDPYYELQVKKKFLEIRKLKRGVVL